MLDTNIGYIIKKAVKSALRLVSFAFLSILLFVGFGQEENGVDGPTKAKKLKSSVNDLVKTPIAYADAPPHSHDDASDVGSSGGSTGCTCCFPAGTQISMADGTTKSIENVKEGDTIVSFNEKDGQNHTTSVDGIYSPMREGLHVINDGFLEVTGDHPLYVNKNGKECWASCDPDQTLKSEAYKHMTDIEKIEVGDSLKHVDGGFIEVTKLDYKGGQVQTYTIRKSEFETYYANGIVAHNC
jgi:hypothetical protein